MEPAELPDGSGGGDALVERWVRAARADPCATGFVLDPNAAEPNKFYRVKISR